jgi:hypothetical protein
VLSPGHAALHVAAPVTGFRPEGCVSTKPHMVRMKLWRVSPAGAFAYWRRHRTRAKGSMKLLVVIFILSAGNATADAENALWCLQSDAFDGDRSCAYATFQQCLADRNFLNRFRVQARHISGLHIDVTARCRAAKSKSAELVRAKEPRCIAVRSGRYPATDGYGSVSASTTKA